jgi:hypothetical protein
VTTGVRILPASNAKVIETRTQEMKFAGFARLFGVVALILEKLYPPIEQALAAARQRGACVEFVE